MNGMSGVLRWLVCSVLAGVGVLGPADERIPLPEPPKGGGPALVECLWARHSTRQFASDAISREDLGRVLWAADGLNRREEKKRTAPSAFGCYPVSIFVVERERISRYDPEGNALILVKRSSEGVKDLRPTVTGPSSFAEAPAVLVLVADPARFPERTETEMRLPWAHAECGAIGQNVYLACASLGLATVFAAVGNPAKLREALSAGEGQEPLYMMPVGKARAQ